MIVKVTPDGSSVELKGEAFDGVTCACGSTDELTAIELHSPIGLQFLYARCATCLIEDLNLGLQR